MGFFSRLFSKFKRNKNANLLNAASTDENNQNSFVESLIVDPASFDGLDSTAIQKKCLTLFGVSPELTKQNIVLDKIFERCYSNNPKQMLNYLHKTCVLSEDNPNVLTINDNLFSGSTNHSTFAIKNNVLTIDSVDSFKTDDHTINIIEKSEYDANGLQISNHFEKSEIPIDATKPEDTVLRNYDVTRQSIDKAMYIDNRNKTKCALDLVSSYYDISRIYVELADNPEKHPLNVYIPPRDMTLQSYDDTLTVITLDGNDIRNSKINTCIQNSTNTYACIQYVKENDPDLYSFLTEQDIDK